MFWIQNLSQNAETIESQKSISEKKSRNLSSFKESGVLIEVWSLQCIPYAAYDVDIAKFAQTLNFENSNSPLEADGRWLVTTVSRQFWF